MRTLDEVIEIASDWTNGFDEMSIEKQMLYYLKMYRSEMQMYADNQKYWEDELKQKIKDFGDAKDRYIKRLKELDTGTLNNPISWNELKDMEGKPVWIEESADNGLWWTYWVIWQDENAVLPEKTYGTTWQAYRKER